MNVSEIMVPHVATCKPDDNLQVVGRMMLDHDIGVVPVVDETNHPIGMITDRDIAMESVKQEKGPFALHAGDIGIKEVLTCRPQDDVETVIDRMRAGAVRRLAVVDKDGSIEGMVSLGDIIYKARPDGGDWDIQPRELESMLAAVTGHHQA